MLNLVFVETALELVPPEIHKHPSVRRNAKRHGKPAEENLLDRSLHHYAMTKLPNQERRGRPDIIHVCLLEAMGSPLNKSGGLRVWVNTQQGFTIDIDPSTRPPRDYFRFKSLMEQLFKDRSSPAKSKEPLLRLRRLGLKELLSEIKPSKVYAYTSHGVKDSFDSVAERLAMEENPVVLIGAYPSGPMSEDVLALTDEVVSVYPEPLESWIVLSRVIYSMERASGVL
ncbi:MAG: 16S rRNA methyltransferase [Candidatus Bathyarchaeota archaeon]|nr:16S rRNA methyltransferase [Candidatus Bathyarchaeota archaeon]